MIHRILIVAALFIAFASHPSAQELRKWTNEDYRSRLVGKTFSTSGALRQGGGRFQTFVYYRPDGLATARAWGSGWKSEAVGTWSIRRGQMCDKYTNPEYGGCFQYYDKGRKIIQTGVGGRHNGRTYSVKIIGNGNVKRLKFAQ